MRIVPTLLLSHRQTDDNQLMWRAAMRAGWDIERIRGYAVPDSLGNEPLIPYLDGLFAPIVASRLGLRLLETTDDWLVHLPREFTRREVRLASLGEARTLTERRFIKPPNDKSFEAKVYESGSELPTEFDESMSVLIAVPVTFEVEYRCFVLDRAVRTISPYARHDRLSKLDDYECPEEEREEARRFAQRLLEDPRVEVPRGVVIDVGRLEGGDWAVVEANGAWGSGLYGCDPDEVLNVIRQSVEKVDPR